MPIPRYLEFAEQAPIARGAGLRAGLQTAFGTAQNLQQLMRNKQIMQQAPLDRQARELQIKQALGNLSLLPAHRKLLEAQTNLALMKAQHPEAVYDSQLAKAIEDKKRFETAGDTDSANLMQQGINGLIQKQQQQSIDPVTLAQQKQLIKDMSGAKQVTAQGLDNGKNLMETLNLLTKDTNAIKNPRHRGGNIIYHLGAGILPNDPDTKKPEGYGRKMARLFDNDWNSAMKDSSRVKTLMYKLVHTPGMRSNQIMLGFIDKATPSPDMPPRAFNNTVRSWKAAATQLMEKSKFMQAAINNGVKDPMVIDNAWGDFLNARPVVDENGNINLANAKAWQDFVPRAGIGGVAAVSPPTVPRETMQQKWNNILKTTTDAEWTTEAKQYGMTADEYKIYAKKQLGIQ